MKQQMTDANSSSSHSFLLDDDATLPFAATDVLSPYDEKVRVGGGREGREGRAEGLRVGGEPGCAVSGWLLCHRWLRHLPNSSSSSPPLPSIHFSFFSRRTSTWRCQSQRASRVATIPSSRES
jgi:hypothetical protein